MSILDVLFRRRKATSVKESLKDIAADRLQEDSIAYYFETYEFVQGGEMNPVRKTMAAILLKERDPQEILAFCKEVRELIEQGNERQEVIRKFQQFVIKGKEDVISDFYNKRT